MADAATWVERLIGDGAEAWAACDRDLRLVAASPKWLADHGVERQALGRSLYEALPDIPEGWKSAHRRALAGVAESCGRARFASADGEARWIASKARPMRSKGGEIVGIVIASEIVDPPAGEPQASRRGARAGQSEAALGRSRVRRVPVHGALPKAIASLWRARPEGSPPSRPDAAGPGEGGVPTALFLDLPGARLLLGARPPVYRLTAARPGASREEFTLSLVVCGRRRVEHLGRDCEGGPGSAVFGTNGDAGASAYRPEGCYLGVFMDADSMLERIPDARSRLMRPVPPDSAPLRLLVSYVTGLMRPGGSVERGVASAVGGHVVDLCALMLGAVGDERALAESRGLRAARAATLCEAIESGAAAPGFSAETLAGRIAVPPRCVHDLLEETGTGFAARVAACRLDVVRGRLADASFDHLTVADIATSCGFYDLGGFDRAFRARFGAAPSGFRAGRG